MGANAVTTFPTYTTGQVLEAADLNITNCGVPVFANSTDRDAAFGGTGEKTLAEGQLCYLENSDVVQYYDGSSWATVGPTASGFAYLTGNSFSAVSSFSLPNDTFSATYRNYVIQVMITSVSTAMSLTMRYRAAGTDASGSNYEHSVLNFGSPGTNTVAALTGTSHHLGYAENGRVAAINVTLFQPFEASPTGFVVQETGGQNSTVYASNGGGNHTLSTSYDAATILTSTGTITGYYRVYGLVNS